MFNHPAIVRVDTPDGETFVYGPYEKREAEELAELCTGSGSMFDGCEAEAESLITMADADIVLGPEIVEGDIVIFDPTGRDLADCEVAGRVIGIDFSEKGYGLVDALFVQTFGGGKYSVTDWRLPEGKHDLVEVPVEPAPSVPVFVIDSEGGRSGILTSDERGDYIAIETPEDTGFRLEDLQCVLEQAGYFCEEAEGGMYVEHAPTSAVFFVKALYS